MQSDGCRFEFQCPVKIVLEDLLAQTCSSIDQSFGALYCLHMSMAYVCGDSGMTYITAAVHTVWILNEARRQAELLSGIELGPRLVRSALHSDFFTSAAN